MPRTFTSGLALGFFLAASSPLLAQSEGWIGGEESSTTSIEIRSQQRSGQIETQPRVSQSETVTLVPEDLELPSKHPRRRELQSILDPALKKVPGVSLRALSLRESGKVELIGISLPQGEKQLRMPGITGFYDALLARSDRLGSVRLKRIQAAKEAGKPISLFTMSFVFLPSAGK